MTLSIFLLGIASSLVAELVSWVNVHLLASTPFKGQAAFFISAAVALVIGIVKEFFFSGLTVVTFTDVLQAFTVAFGISQLWFGTISSWFSKYLQVSA